MDDVLGASAPVVIVGAVPASLLVSRLDECSLNCTHLTLLCAVICKPSPFPHIICTIQVYKYTILPSSK